MKTQSHTSVPGVNSETSSDISSVLQGRLVSLLDLQLALKHVHWNVVGPNFLSVHEMLDQQVAPIRDMSDEVAERIATLGSVPRGTAGAIVAERPWDDYALGRDSSVAHLNELDKVYSGVIESHRKAIGDVAADPITEDLLISQTSQLELFQWFIRSFAESVTKNESGS